MLPPTNFTESWDYVKHFSERIRCHICKSEKNVKRGNIQQTTCGFTHAVDAGFPDHWQLCEDCHNNGWETPESSYMGSFTYINNKTGELKTHR